MTVFDLLSDIIQADGGITAFAKLISDIVSSCMNCPARYSCRIRNNPLHFGGLCYEEIENYLRSELKVPFDTPNDFEPYIDGDCDKSDISYIYEWRFKPIMKSPNKYVRLIPNEDKGKK